MTEEERTKMINKTEEYQPNKNNENRIERLIKHHHEALANDIDEVCCVFVAVVSRDVITSKSLLGMNAKIEVAGKKKIRDVLQEGLIIQLEKDIILLKELWNNRKEE